MPSLPVLQIYLQPHVTFTFVQGWIPNQNLTETPFPPLHSPSLPFPSLPPLRSRPP